MTETNNMFAVAMTAIGSVILDFYSHLAPWLLLGLALVLVDLRYGVLAAKARGEVIRISRAWRRTINKAIDYLCWVTVAELMSRTFAVSLGVPVVSMSMLFVIYGIEISSCVNNYFEYKGIQKKFNFFRILGKKELEDAIEDK